MIKLQPFWCCSTRLYKFGLQHRLSRYFAFLTVYSDTIFSENIAFKIWDASQGKVIVATMNANTTSFEENGVLGRLSQPAILKTRVWWSKKYLSIKDGLGYR
jgi:hypothetical protein